MFPNRLKVESSNAEMALLIRLQDLGIPAEHHTMSDNCRIPLSESDIFVPYGERGLHIFLDGVWLDRTGMPKGHGSLRQGQWDDLRNRVLNWKRQPFLAFQYRPPHRKQDLQMWTTQILEVLKK